MRPLAASKVTSSIIAAVDEVTRRALTVEYEFTVVIEQDEDGRFLAICPALQGCYTEGETLEEAQELILDAIRLHVEDRLESGEPIYQEVSSEKVRIAV